MAHNNEPEPWLEACHEADSIVGDRMRFIGGVLLHNRIFSHRHERRFDRRSLEQDGNISNKKQKCHPQA